jgi:hypothetical protein
MDTDSHGLSAGVALSAGVQSTVKTNSSVQIVFMVPKGNGGAMLRSVRVLRSVSFESTPRPFVMPSPARAFIGPIGGWGGGAQASAPFCRLLGAKSRLCKTGQAGCALCAVRSDLHVVAFGARRYGGGVWYLQARLRANLAMEPPLDFLLYSASAAPALQRNGWQCSPWRGGSGVELRCESPLMRTWGY